MRILVFGADGMLGHKLVQVLKRDAEVRGTVRGIRPEFERARIIDSAYLVAGVDAFEPEAARRAIEAVRPNVVINAIGVVKQVAGSKDVINALTVNSIFPHRLAELAADFGFRLICISTDCVFDGVRGFYSESDVPNAIDLYGKSKQLGEVLAPSCLTLRTSILGRELITGHSLVEWFLSNEGGSVKGFSKAIYSGFPTIVLAEIIRSIIVDHTKLEGLYHVSSDPINKFELLKLIREAYGSHIKIEPSDDLVIDRSLDSSRFRSVTGFVPESWEKMVEKMASDPTLYRKY